MTIAVPRSVSDAAPDNGTVAASVYTGVFPGLQYQGTISGLKLNAQNVLYLQDKDVAGEYSKAARMPSSTTGYWFVKKPKGRMLVVKDYNQSDSTTALQVYRNVFSDPSIAGGAFGNFDIFDVGYGLTYARQIESDCGFDVRKFCSDKSQSCFYPYSSIVRAGVLV